MFPRGPFQCLPFCDSVFLWLLLCKGTHKGQGNFSKGFCWSKHRPEGNFSQISYHLQTNIPCTVMSLQPQRLCVTLVVPQSRAPRLACSPWAQWDRGAPPAWPPAANWGTGSRLCVSWAGLMVPNIRRALQDAHLLPNGNQLGTARKPCNSCRSVGTLMKMLALWERIYPYSKPKLNIGSGIFLFLFFLKSVTWTAGLHWASTLNMSSNYYLAWGSALPDENWINSTDTFYLKLSQTASETNCNLHFWWLSPTLTLRHVSLGLTPRIPTLSLSRRRVGWRRRWCRWLQVKCDGSARVRLRAQQKGSHSASTVRLWPRHEALERRAF